MSSITAVIETQRDTREESRVGSDPEAAVRRTRAPVVRSRLERPAETGHRASELSTSSRTARLPVAPANHKNRHPLLRAVRYMNHVTLCRDRNETADTEDADPTGTALSLNLSPGGMLLLLNDLPTLETILQVWVPSAGEEVEIPCLAEVRWFRSVPFPNGGSCYLAGLRFLL